MTEEHLKEKEKALEELRKEHKKAFEDYKIARDEEDVKSGKTFKPAPGELPMAVAYLMSEQERERNNWKKNDKNR